MRTGGGDPIPAARGRRRRPVVALVALLLLLLTPGLAFAETYEEMLWADWPRLPTDSEIEEARAALVAEDSVGDATLRTLSAEAVKVHAVDPEQRLGGQAGTGNHCVAIVTTQWTTAEGEQPPVTRVDPLYFNTETGTWAFGVAAMTATESLDAWYAAGYAEGWVEEGATAAGALPWRTVAGWLGAVAAAAVAIAGAASSGAASSRAGRRGDRFDPDQAVGYVLHLSTNRLTVAEGRPTAFVATAYEVLPSGGFRPAPAARIALASAPGVAVNPAAGAGAVQATVTRTGPVPRGAVLTVRASAPRGATSAAVTLEGAEGSRLVTRFEPADPPPLRTDGRHRLTLVAAVEVSPADAANPQVDGAAARASIAFAAAGEWVDLSAAVDYAEGSAVAIQASQPDPSHAVQPPESASVRVSARVGARELVAVVPVALARLPEVDARPDEVTFAVGSGRSAEVQAWVTDGGGTDWEFTTAWRHGGPELASVSLEPQGPTTATLTLTESAVGRADADRPETASTLRVIASAETYEPIERYVRVVVVQEGVFVDRTGADPSTRAFTVRADGSARPTEVDVRVFVRDPSSGVVRADVDLARAVVFEVAGEAATPGRAGLLAGGFSAEAIGVRPANVPSATFALAIERALPTGGEALHATVRASAPGLEGERSAALVPLRLIGVDTDPYSPAWATELERCRHVIDDYVPSEYRARLHALLDQRARTMGAEGLYAMRHRLWSFAHDQLVREAHEHLDAAWWAEQVEGTLDWVSWCGDIALGVASGSLVGTVGSIAIGMLKPVLVSAVEAWVNDRSLEEWAAAQGAILVGVVEGAATDVDLLAKLTGERKAFAWALFIAYYFAKELYNDPQVSVTNAMTNVGRQLRDEGLVIFLRRIAGVRPAGTPAEQAGPPKAGGETPTKTADGADGAGPARRSQPPRARADAMAAEVRSQTAAGEKVSVRTVERILRDPDAMRELKRNHPEVWRDFHETRAKVYASHDARLTEWMRENLPGAKDRTIEIESFGTPDGVDRDYRAGYVTKDPVTGARQFIEIPKERWAGKSQEIFAAETGGPTDRAGAAQWAKDHQQLATDAYHAEASVDMADQAWVTTPDGRRERRQVTPSVDRVKAGQTTLLDPEGLGRTYETKVAEAYHEGNLLDAYRQADKAVHSLEGVRDGYAQQHYGVGEIPPKLAAGIQAVKDVQAGRLDPAGAEAELRRLDFAGLPDFMERVSGLFGSLRWARRA